MSRQILLSALSGLRQHYKRKMGEDMADPSKGAPGIPARPGLEGGGDPDSPKLTITIGGGHKEPDADDRGGPSDDDEDDY